MEKISIKSLSGEVVTRHEFDNGEIRFTIERDTFSMLVATVHNGVVTWIKNGYSV